MKRKWALLLCTFILVGKGVNASADSHPLQTEKVVQHVQAVSEGVYFPHTTAASVESAFPKSIKRGSANFIRDDVLITAAHNLYDADEGGVVTEVYVTPARKKEQKPYGTIKVKSFHYIKDFEAGTMSVHLDLGVLVLEEPVGAQVGSLSIVNSAQEIGGETFALSAYPELEKQVFELYTSTGQLKSDGEEFFRHSLGALSGSSGGAIYDAKHRVVGVHIGYDKHTRENIAVKLNEGNLAFIYSVLNEQKLEGWKKLSGTWYYYKGGTKQTGWQKVGETWYYLDSSGKMQTGWQKVNGKWYYLRSSGAMATGWEFINGKWYFLDRPNGDMKTGWFQVNGKWYYAYSSGALAVSTTVDGYRVNSNGEWVR